MGSQEITSNSGFYISLGVEILAVVVLLALVVVGIVIAIRAKTGTGKGCGIVMAIAFALQSGLVAIWILITIITGFESNRAGQTRLVHASDGSCEISVPASWLDDPNLSKEAVLGAKDPLSTEYVVVFADSKEDYSGSLADYAKDCGNRMRERLKSPEVGEPEPVTINGRSAVRQNIRGEINRLRIAYVITYFEDQNKFYRVFCWSIESKATAVKGDFDKIAKSFQENSAKQEKTAKDANHI
jgi:hypothetical protein